MADNIILPPRVDIPSVSELRDTFLASYTLNQNVTVDGSTVETFSAAGAQLLISFSNMLKASGGSLRLINPSTTLKRDLKSLGLPELIGELS